MDGNPIQLDGAFYLLASINGMYETALKELHLKVNLPFSHVPSLNFCYTVVCICREKE